MKIKTLIAIIGFTVFTLFAMVRSVPLMPQGFLAKNWNMLFWTIIGIGGLTLIIFGLKKFGASPNSRLPSWLKWPLWIVGIIAVVFLTLTYRGQLQLEQFGHSLKGLANGAITKEITISSLAEISWKDIPSGKYRIDVIGNDTYLYKCPGYKGAAYGYPKGKRSDGGALIGPTGGIILWSGIAPEVMHTDGEMLIVGQNDQVFGKFRTDCPGNAEVVQSAKISLQLFPIAED